MYGRRQGGYELIQVAGSLCGSPFCVLGPGVREVAGCASVWIEVAGGVARIGHISIPPLALALTGVWGRDLPRSRSKSSFECSDCGSVSARWQGQCSGCGAWNTVQEIAAPVRRGGAARGLGSGAASVEVAIRMTDLPTESPRRLVFGMPELDRVFGGGIVPGSVVLLAGDPGIGKSTLTLQAAAAAAGADSPVLYVTGEESAEQIRLRAVRLGIDGSNLYLLATNRLEDALREAEVVKPVLMVVDSIQTVSTDESESAPGTPSQIQACAWALTEIAKRSGMPVVLTGHVTKDGGIAGPRLLEHAVDVVLHLGGEAESGLRLLQGVKNRYGPTNEVGVFEMGEDGLSGVADPSKVFLAHRREGAPGSAVATLIEGTRALTVEVQALTSSSTLPSPRRVATGVDLARLDLVLAVLSRRLGLPVHTQDVIVNVPGGLRVSEPAVDLALALAIVSSMRDVAVKPGISSAAEVGLGGELRPVMQGERRAAEARRLGMDVVLLGRQPDGAAARREAKSGGRHFDGLAEAIAEAVPARRGKRVAAGNDTGADDDGMRAARPPTIFT